VGEATCSRPQFAEEAERQLQTTDVLASPAENLLLQRLQKATRDSLPRAEVWDRRKGWEKMPSQNQKYCLDFRKWVRKQFGEEQDPMGVKGQFRRAGVTLSRAVKAHNCWGTDRERAGPCPDKRKGDTDPTLGRWPRKTSLSFEGEDNTNLGPGSGHSPPPPSVQAREPGLASSGATARLPAAPPGQRPVRPGRLRGRAARPPREAPSTSSGPRGPASSSGQSAFLQKKETTLAARRSMARPPRLSAAA